MIDRRTWTFGAATALAAPLAALAQGASQRPVTIVASYAAGGLVDVLARSLAQRLSAAWSRPVIVENRPGANQLIAAQYVAKSAPDGATFLMCDEGAVTLNPHVYPKLPYSPDDLTAVADLVDVKTVLMTNKAFGATSLEDFVLKAKSRPGGINYASLGLGGVPHLMMERLRKDKPFDAVHAPFKSYPEATQSLLSDQVQAMFGSVGGPPMQHLRSRTLVPLAVNGTKRSPILPDVPTFEELSITQFPRAHFSLLGPAGLSTALVQRVNTDVRNAMRSEQLTTLLAPNALEALDVSAEEFSRSLAMQSQLYADIVKRIGLRLE